MMKKIKNITILLAMILSIGSVSNYAQEETAVSAPVSVAIDNLEINNTNLLDALDLITLKGGIRIIVDPQIQGKVSIYLRNMDVYDALRVILEANGMAFSKIEGSDAQREEVVAMKLAEGKMILGEDPRQPIIEVMTAKEFKGRFGFSFSEKIQTRIISLIHCRGDEVLDILNQMKGPSGKVIYNEQTNALVVIDEPDKLKAMTTVVKEWDVPLVTKKFYLRYVTASQIIPYIKEVLNLTTGKVEIEEASNTLIVTDKSLRLKEIEDLIKKLDIEQRHVLIETKILQIVLSDEHQEGIDWEAIVSNYQTLKFEQVPPSPEKIKVSVQNFNVPVNNQEKPTDGLSLGTISEEDYAVLLDALDTVGDIHIISNIKIATLHNKAAELMVKAFSYQSIQGRSALKEGNKEGTLTVPEIKFQLTPFVNGDETITFNINPDIDSGEALVENPEAQFLSGTNVKVQQGSTVVLGGLFKETMVELKEKIPLLGDIPILGLAFRHQGPHPRKAEIIVFLTPKVVIKE